MNLTDSKEPITELKSKSADFIRRARETGQPIVITQNGRATAVLQDVESFQRQRDALLLLKLLTQGDVAHQQGKSMSHSEAEKHFAETLADHDMY